MLFVLSLGGFSATEVLLPVMTRCSLCYRWVDFLLRKFVVATVCWHNGTRACEFAGVENENVCV